MPMMLNVSVVNMSTVHNSRNYCAKYYYIPVLSRLNVSVVNMSTVHNSRNYCAKYYYIPVLSILKDKLYENRTKFKSLCITAIHGTDKKNVGYAYHHSV
jgi:hypothetical protein